MIDTVECCGFYRAAARDAVKYPTVHNVPCDIKWGKMLFEEKLVPKFPFIGCSLRKVRMDKLKDNSGTSKEEDPKGDTGQRRGLFVLMRRGCLVCGPGAFHS